jgi:ABC-type molybdate transport system permease subunit
MMQIPGHEAAAFRLVLVSIVVSLLALCAGNLLTKTPERS